MNGTKMLLVVAIAVLGCASEPQADAVEADVTEHVDDGRWDPNAGAGLRWNGTSLNGVRVNGPVFQGPVFQGPVFQGPNLQGTAVQAEQSTRVVGIILDP